MVAVRHKINFGELVNNAADASVWNLTRLEKTALASLIEDIVEKVADVGTYNGWFAGNLEKVADQGDLADLTLALTETLLTEGPVFPRLLAARMTETFLCGDRSLGEADPPEDGILGQTIAEYMAKVAPVVKLRLHGEWPEIFFPAEEVSESD